MTRLSNYPNGFKDGLTIRGVPLSLGHPGKVFWVNSSSVLSATDDGVAGADTPSAGTYQRPFATIDYAIGQCTASRGDIIFVMPGYTETISGASGITVDVDGISIIGLGNGDDRPTLTFSATASTVVVSAADVTIENIVTTPSIDSVVSPWVVSGANCYLDVEHQDASSTVEAVRAVLTTATADDFQCNLVYKGFTAGNATVNAVRLVGADNAKINVDFYGVASTSVVEFLTTACTNVTVTGYMYNSGTTDGTKLVIDTITGSTWYADIEDGAAGARFSGGSGAALASDDVTAINTTLGTSNATTTDSINGKLGTDTELSDRSIFDIMVGDGPATYPAAAEAANDVSIAEVLRNISDLQVPRTVLKSTGSMASGFGTADSPVSLFTVTGDVMCQVFASVDVAVTSTATNGVLSVGVAGNVQALIPNEVADGTALDVGDSWSYATAADANAAAIDTGWVVVGNGVDIVLTITVNNMTAGDIDFYCRYIPLTAGSSVVAA